MENTKIKNLTNEQKAEILSKFYNKEKNSLSEIGKRDLKENTTNDKGYFYITRSRIYAKRESKFSAQFIISSSLPLVWIPIKDIFGLDNKVSLEVRLRINDNNDYYIDKDNSIKGVDLRKYAD